MSVCQSVERTAFQLVCHDLSREAGKLFQLSCLLFLDDEKSKALVRSFEQGSMEMANILIRNGATFPDGNGQCLFYQFCRIGSLSAGCSLKLVVFPNLL